MKKSMITLSFVAMALLSTQALATEVSTVATWKATAFKQSGQVSANTEKLLKQDLSFDEQELALNGYSVKKESVVQDQVGYIVREDGTLLATPTKNTNSKNIFYWSYR